MSGQRGDAPERHADTARASGASCSIAAATSRGVRSTCRRCCRPARRSGRGRGGRWPRAAGRGRGPPCPTCARSGRRRGGTPAPAGRHPTPARSARRPGADLHRLPAHDRRAVVGQAELRRVLVEQAHLVVGHRGSGGTAVRLPRRRTGSAPMAGSVGDSSLRSRGRERRVSPCRSPSPSTPGSPPSTPSGPTRSSPTSPEPRSSSAPSRRACCPTTTTCSTSTSPTRSTTSRRPTSSWCPAG